MLELWRPMGTRQRIPTSTLYTPGYPRLSQRTPDKLRNNQEVILQQWALPGQALCESRKHYISSSWQNTQQCQSSSVTLYAIFNPSENCTETIYSCLFITRAKPKVSQESLLYSRPFCVQFVTWNFLPSLIHRYPLVWISLCKGLTH